MRKLILTALDWTRPKDPPFSLGHASILANLIAKGAEVFPRAWSVNHASFNSDEVVDFALKHAAPNVDFAIGAYVWNERPVQNILSQLVERKFPGRIIVGGPQVSYIKNGLERYYPHAQAFIRGYAEQPLAELLNESQPSVIDGVHFAGQPDSGKTAIPRFEDLPSPFLSGIIQPQPFIRWETQRGCPFKCSFCQHREPNSEMKRRNFPLLRVGREVQWILENRVVNDIAVLDPVFNSGPHYLQILQMLVDGKYTGKISLQCRLEMVKPGFLELVAELNKTARVVLEFGLQTIHREEQIVIDRINRLDVVTKVLADTVRMGIETEVSLIFGLPKQTVASFKESIEFCKKAGATRILAFPLMLLRGTPLYEHKAELGLIESDSITMQHGNENRIYQDIPTVVESPSFTYNDWLIMSEMAQELEVHNKKIKEAEISRPLSQKLVSFFKANACNDQKINITDYDQLMKSS